jgi:glycerophosphoryl diester phosphodiesterase
LAALPILLLGGQGCRASLGASWQTTQGRVLRIAALLLAWWLGTGALWALLSWIAHWLANPLYDWAGLIPSRVIPLVATCAALTGGMAMLWGIVTLGVHQFAVTRLTIELRGLPLPAVGQSSNERKPTGSTRRFIRIAWLTALLLALASALTGWAMVRDLNLVDSVQITAHRGSSFKAPENTLAAIRQAIEDGTDYIEIDVQTCADGSVVVIHDRDLMRVGGDPRRVEDLTLDEIQRIDVGIRFGKDFAGEHVPTLEEVIDGVRGRAKLNIELKYNRPDPRLVPAVVELVEDKNFLEHCVITSLQASAIQEFKAAKPEAITGLIVTASVGRVARVEADFLSIAAHRATASAIRGAHRAGKAVHVWTVNDPQAMLQMIETGADNIITDKPDVLRRVLEERALLSDPEKLAVRLRVLFAGGVPIHSAGPSQQ